MKSNRALTFKERLFFFKCLFRAYNFISKGGKISAYIFGQSVLHGVVVYSRKVIKIVA